MSDEPKLLGIKLKVVMAIFALILAILYSPTTGTTSSGSGADDIVRIALAEEGTVSGEKYWSYTMGSAFIDGDQTPWCGAFVAWCAEQCGFVTSGIIPKSGYVPAFVDFYQAKGEYQTKEGYTPKAGDLIIYSGSAHIGIVVKSDSDYVYTIEGNTNSSGSYSGGMVAQHQYPLNAGRIMGYCTPSYPTGTSIDIPEPYGTGYTYMDWAMVTAPSSTQYKLRIESGEHYDSNGFGKIGERYVIACTPKYGEVGDYVNWTLENGTVIETVIGDVKNTNDSGANEWGHQNGAHVVEFCVERSKWYGTTHYPTDFHSNWDSRVVKASRTGSYW